jgi:hypothetical protein
MTQKVGKYGTETVINLIFSFSHFVWPIIDLTQCPSSNRLVSVLISTRDLSKSECSVLQELLLAKLGVLLFKESTGSGELSSNSVRYGLFLLQNGNDEGDLLPQFGTGLQALLNQTLACLQLPSCLLHTISGQDSFHDQSKGQTLLLLESQLRYGISEDGRANLQPFLPKVPIQDALEHEPHQLSVTLSISSEERQVKVNHVSGQVKLDITLQGHEGEDAGEKGQRFVGLLWLYGVLVWEHLLAQVGVAWCLIDHLRGWEEDAQHFQEDQD